MTLQNYLRGITASWLRWTLSALVVATALLFALTATPSASAGRGERPESSPAGSTDVSTHAAAAVVSVPERFYGSSGNLRAWIDTPEAIASDSVLQPLVSGVGYDEPGLYRLSAVAPDGDSLAVLSLRPLTEKKGSKLDGYSIGDWPQTSSPMYHLPAGFIEVTAENRGTNVSKHFVLSDFLTHDQQDVWPKFLVLRPKLLDKLELLEAELQREGLPSRLHVMSGFRTPQYNALGVGEKGGRATHSRHMYGDASDVFVDADQDGMMDDLDGDGKITVRDALVLRAAAERVEAAHPELVGGIGAYPSNGVHGPFVHVDTRGFKARWGAAPAAERVLASRATR